MRLRHPKPVLTHSNKSENGKPPLASRFTRWIYFGVLIFLLVYIVWYGFFSYFYINERGLVEVDRIEVSSTRGGRILELPVSTDDHVKRNDLLVRLKSPNDCASSQMAGLNQPSPELRSLRFKQQADRAHLNRLYFESREKKTRLNGINLRHSMELSLNGSGAASRQKLEDDIQQLEGKKRELYQLIANRARLISKLVALQKKGLTPSQLGCHDELIRAPYAGTIISKIHSVFEVMQRTETIMALIPKHASVRIEVYLRNDMYNMLKVGHEFSITFPDGQKSKSRIEKITSTSLPYPRRNINHYFPDRTRLLVILRPSDKADLPLWKKFNQLEVEVYGWQ